MSGKRLERPTEDEERQALRWLCDVRVHGYPLERVFAASVIATLGWYEQELHGHRGEHEE